MPRGTRWALSSLALLLSLVLLAKGRVCTPKGAGTAFVAPVPAGGVVVRLAGDVGRPGVHRFPDGTTAETAIKMTVGARSLTGVSSVVAGRRLTSGDLVTVHSANGQPHVVTVETMPVQERMLLGIPLDPDRMTREEWAALPGIGPVLAERIETERHKNGVFRSLAGVARVPGIGPGKLKTLQRYF
ncbi:ComEA family DNA-binding protein [Geomonas limicola]|nr:helix-hairpin-helix domain-containing protein [Geomonas limicola]